MSRYRFAIVVLTIGSLVAVGRSGTGPTDDTPDLAKAAKKIIDQTNNFRGDERRSPVTVNDKLVATARDFADFMARSGKYGHEADDQTPAERVRKHDYDYCLVEENIAHVYRSTSFTTDELAAQFVDGWKNSAGHRKNMLNPDVTETGVVIARSAETGTYYAVQMFGRPKSLAIEFRVTNNSDAKVEYKVGDQPYAIQPRYVMTHQVCLPTDVTFQSPNAAGSQTIRPANGDRYTIVAGDGGKPTVRKE